MICGNLTKLSVACVEKLRRFPSDAMTVKVFFCGHKMWQPKSSIRHNVVGPRFAIVNFGGVGFVARFGSSIRIQPSIHPSRPSVLIVSFFQSSLRSYHHLSLVTHLCACAWMVYYFYHQCLAHAQSLVRLVFLLE